ncbi:MAG: hypothetical protein ABIF11_00515 [Nitrospirota bacterium]
MDCFPVILVFGDGKDAVISTPVGNIIPFFYRFVNIYFVSYVDSCNYIKRLFFWLYAQNGI